MTLSDILTVGSRVQLTLSCLAKVMFRELVLIAGLIVDLSPPEIVVWLPIVEHSVLLGHHLIFVELR